MFDELTDGNEAWINGKVSGGALVGFTVPNSVDDNRIDVTGDEGDCITQYKDSRGDIVWRSRDCSRSYLRVCNKPISGSVTHGNI